MVTQTQVVHEMHHDVIVSNIQYITMIVPKQLVLQIWQYKCAVVCISYVYGIVLFMHVVTYTTTLVGNEC